MFEADEPAAAVDRPYAAGEPNVSEEIVQFAGEVSGLDFVPPELLAAASLDRERLKMSPPPLRHLPQPPPEQSPPVFVAVTAPSTRSLEFESTPLEMVTKTAEVSEDDLPVFLVSDPNDVFTKPRTEGTTSTTSADIKAQHDSGDKGVKSLLEPLSCPLGCPLRFTLPYRMVDRDLARTGQN